VSAQRREQGRRADRQARRHARATPEVRIVGQQLANIAMRQIQQ